MADVRAQTPERLTLSGTATGRTSLGASDTVLMLLSVTDEHGMGVSGLTGDGLRLFAYPCPDDSDCVLVPLTIAKVTENADLPGIYTIRAAIDQGRKDLVRLPNGPAGPFLLRVVKARPAPSGTRGTTTPVAAQGQVIIPSGTALPAAAP